VLTRTRAHTRTYTHTVFLQLRMSELERTQEISREKVRAQEETIDQQNIQINSLTGRLQNFSGMMVHRVYMCLCMSLRARARTCAWLAIYFMCMHVCLCACSETSDFSKKNSNNSNFLALRRPQRLGVPAPKKCLDASRIPSAPQMKTHTPKKASAQGPAFFFESELRVVRIF